MLYTSSTRCVSDAAFDIKTILCYNRYKLWEGADIVKKQTITKQNIQQELLTKLNKRKTVAIWLTTISFMSIICYVIYVIAYINGSDWKNDRLSFSVPSVAIPIGAFVILFLLIFLVRYYYLDLYKIKTGKIEITEEQLYQKAIEYVSYYRRSEKENALYFQHGRIAVDETVYLYSNIGDSFYMVFLKSKNSPNLIYHTKYHEIEKSQE